MLRCLSPIARIALIGLMLMLGIPAATSADSPNVLAIDAYSTGTTTATVEGVLNPESQSTTYAAQYDLESSTWCQTGTGSPAHTTAGTDPVIVENATQPVSVDLTGLTEGSNYCANLIATNGDGQTDGGPVYWAQGAPTVGGDDVEATGASTSTIHGVVNPAGNDTSYAAKYDTADSTWCASGGKSGSPADTTATTDLGTTDGSTFHDVAIDLTGLTAGASYCGDIVATNVDGLDEGDQSFWTQVFTEYTLTVTLSGPGSGRAVSSPAGIDCGGGGTACSAKFAPGTQVTLTVTPAPGSVLLATPVTGCTTAAPGGPATCVYTIQADLNIGLEFWTSPPQEAMTVFVEGTGSGSVTSNPAGITQCSLECTYYEFAQGTVVTLTATPGPGSSFAGWSGGCSGTGTCTITMSAPVTVNAIFNAVQAPPRCKVPKLVGKKLTAAKTAIRNAHCRVGKITRTYSAKVRPGRVISQRPTAGSKHPAGTAVKLGVSKGPKPK